MYYRGDVIRCGSQFGIVVNKVNDTQYRVLWEDGRTSIALVSSFRAVTLEELTAYAIRVGALEMLWGDY